jgi:hypothetical protein
VKSIFAGVLTLIALQAFGSGNGPAQGGKLLVWIQKGVTRALSPDVAAIPTAKSGHTSTASDAAASKAGGIVGQRNPTIGTPVQT